MCDASHTANRFCILEITGLLGRLPDALIACSKSGVCAINSIIAAVLVTSLLTADINSAKASRIETRLPPQARNPWRDILVSNRKALTESPLKTESAKSKAEPSAECEATSRTSCSPTLVKPSNEK
ncbi:hypothetical protein OAV41_02935 [Planctomycetota bacterium]|nr:hypothetical protein [Planctomycetota bacterium]